MNVMFKTCLTPQHLSHYNTQVSIYTTNTKITITTTCVDHLIKNNTHFMETQFIASIPCKQSIITFSTCVINLVTVTVTQEKRDCLH